LAPFRPKRPSTPTAGTEAVKQELSIVWGDRFWPLPDHQVWVAIRRMGTCWAAVKSMSPNGCTTSTTARGLYIEISNPRRGKNAQGLDSGGLFCAGATMRTATSAVYRSRRKLVLAALLLQKSSVPENLVRLPSLLRGCWAMMSNRSRPDGRSVPDHGNGHHHVDKPNASAPAFDSRRHQATGELTGRRHRWQQLKGR